jgi:hypothetical protein
MGAKFREEFEKLKILLPRLDNTYQLDRLPMATASEGPFPVEGDGKLYDLAFGTDHKDVQEIKNSRDKCRKYRTSFSRAIKIALIGVPLYYLPVIIYALRGSFH